jgi:hypothetical protein
MDPVPSAIYHSSNITPDPSESQFLVSPHIKIEEPLPGQPAKKKQKRNKPTLSCEECVERKTKVSFLHKLFKVNPWTVTERVMLQLPI